MNNSYYFSHDMNARSDQKIQRLIAKHGYAGYGYFWAIIEDLYLNANAMRTHYEVIAFALHTSEDVVKSIVNDFDLFIVDGDFFGSLSIQRRIDEREAKSVKASESARVRWHKKQSDANAMRTQCERNAIKERKGKEIEYIKGEINKEVSTSTHKPSKQEREIKFRETVTAIGAGLYDKDMLEDFCRFWTESNPNALKMRWEKQEVFDVARRLITWDKNNTKYKPLQITQKPKVTW